ncbi:hypothetical protein HY029_03995 [Candidatus Gottesmanbacteria bacterium]|nr:hypothetical protein [Candidatus Gottesmanbacteria bacterium]
MKLNKKVLIIAVILIVLAIIGVMGVLKIKSLFKTESPQEIPTPTVVLPTVADSIKVDLTAKNDNKIVDIKIAGIPQDTDTIEYELTYTTGTGLPRGVLGKITVNGQSSISRNDIDLGTCSRGRCVYDVGVNSINLSLKFNSSGGNSSVFQKTYPL